MKNRACLRATTKKSKCKKLRPASRGIRRVLPISQTIFACASWVGWKLLRLASSEKSRLHSRLFGCIGS
jgi:hypothetical protein